MNTVVKTRQGKVRGSIIDGVATFKGIPYAAPRSGSCDGVALILTRTPIYSVWLFFGVTLLAA